MRKLTASLLTTMTLAGGALTGVALAAPPHPNAPSHERASVGDRSRHDSVRDRARHDSSHDRSRGEATSHDPARAEGR